MKILIVSKPRMGSTVLGENLSKLYRLEYYNEPSYRGTFKKDNGVIKIVVGNIKTWENNKKIILKPNYDKVILLRRNEDDCKISFAHLKLRRPNSKGPWHQGYRVIPNLQVDKWIDNYYNNGEKIYQEIIGMNINPIELSYENLYNEDKDIRKKELDKVIGEDKVHWLLHKNMLDKLHPQFKYTNLPLNYEKKDIL